MKNFGTCGTHICLPDGYVLPMSKASYQKWCKNTSWWLLTFEKQHQEKHKKILNFIDFLALEHIILKSKVQKVANYYLGIL